jgi:Zn2+/Cd2+-exporting ATPase
MDVTKDYQINNLDCAICADKLEMSLHKIPDVASAKVNFLTKRLTVTVRKGSDDTLWSHIENTIRQSDVQTDALSSEDGSTTVSCSLEKSKSHLRQSRRIEISLLYRILITTMLFGISYFVQNPSLNFAMLLIAYTISGYDVLFKAIRNLIHGQLFDENFLMTIATVGAFAIKEFPEAVAVMAFYQIGEFFQQGAIEKSRKSITGLMDIRPESATVIRDGRPISISPESVAIGDILQVKPGERIAVDSIVVSGESYIDTKALTGESMPRKVGPGDDLISGCINSSGLILAKVSKAYADSTVAKILRLVEDSANRKAKTEQFITTFARVYTPIVVVSAVLLATIPVLVIPGALFSTWLYRALVFLVISCPCALVVSVPLGFFAGIGAAAKIGVLVKGGNYLQALASVRTVVFDKTGTLTTGTFRVQYVRSINESIYSEQEILSLAASLETGSNHPIARSIVDASNDIQQVCTDIREVAGFGMIGRIKGKEVVIGGSNMMESQGITLPLPDSETVPSDTNVVFIAIDGLVAGMIGIADEIKSEAKRAINALKQQGIKKTVMLTGDREIIARSVAQEIGIDEVHAQLLPDRKVAIVEDILAYQQRKEKVLFVGDGINDAPVLARVDIGMAMGSLGSDAAIEAADVVIMTDDLQRIAQAMALSKRTLRIVKQNIVLALGIKAIVLILGAFGIANMWAAVFADTGVALIAILNSLRILRIGRIIKT